MDEGTKVLVIDDELAIRSVLKVSLTAAGCVVQEAASGGEGIQRARACQPDIVLLDLGLPDVDGVEVVRRLREFTMSPVLILSIRGQESQKVAVLDAGADDYLTKPFGAAELLARMRALLRRAAATPPATQLVCADLVIDLPRRQIRVGDREIRLTRTEFALLKSLMKRSGNVATQAQLVREVWGRLEYQSALHVLHVTIANLRRKTEPDLLRPQYILTELGIGYRIGAASDAVGAPRASGRFF
jgi:two-component system KDP operon response regulator KdpE